MMQNRKARASAYQSAVAPVKAAYENTDEAKFAGLLKQVKTMWPDISDDEARRRAESFRASF
jgi:hypothetical protein